ncbi:Hint domain-containing protein [Aestuariibius sp. 2305UL40-4]|uniref:Hint domain-containing protein n=1 Tax=Aestuariibius violaceus TaxID=3234132 RepID=UPI00345E57B7
MPFLFTWDELGGASGSVVETDDTNGLSTTVTVNSAPAYTYFPDNGTNSEFPGGTILTSGASEPATSSVGFSTPVTDVTFEIYDLDSDETTFDDEITIIAFDADGIQIPITFSNLESYHVQTDANTVEADGNTSDAFDGAGAPDSITVTIPGPVSTIFIITDNGSSGEPAGTIGVGSISATVFCFARETLILTDRGEVPVETLKVGDLVETLDKGLQPITWIGHRAVPAEGSLAPIRIDAGAIGNERDLILSPQHRVLLRGWQAELYFGEPEILVAAKHLLGSDRVNRCEGGEVEYYHILFKKHEIVFAEGAPCESFHPGEMSMDSIESKQLEELLKIFPELETQPDSYGQAARLSLKSYEGQLVTSSF